MSRAGTATAVCGTVLALLATAPAAGAQQPDPLPAVLSNERDLTRWAHANTRAPARAEPSARSPRVGRLRFRTEDGRPEVYLALRGHTTERGDRWVQVRLLGRPNGRTGWVRREDLAGFNIVRTQLVIYKKRLRAVLYRNGRRIWSAPVGVGRRNAPTPEGRFYIRERLKPPRGSFYGSWAFGTSGYSRLTDWPGGGVVGIHGTTRPRLIPGRPSHGCVRLRNADISRLARLMPIGTPVLVR